MKLLTPSEYNVLLQTVGPCKGHKSGNFSDAENDTLENLAEQGRIRIGLCPWCGGENTVWITPSGREALRLWIAIEAYNDL